MENGIDVSGEIKENILLFKEISHES